MVGFRPLLEGTAPRGRVLLNPGLAFPFFGATSPSSAARAGSSRKEFGARSPRPRTGSDYVAPSPNPIQVFAPLKQETRPRRKKKGKKQKQKKRPCVAQQKLRLAFEQPGMCGMRFLELAWGNPQIGGFPLASLQTNQPTPPTAKKRYQHNQKTHNHCSFLVSLPEYIRPATTPPPNS